MHNRRPWHAVSCPAGSYGWLPFIAVAILFFIIGFVTWLNGPLISFMKIAFSLDDISAFLVPFIFYLSYFLFAIPASKIITRKGLRQSLIYALSIMIMGMLVTAQFIKALSYPGALFGFLILGSGLALLQVAVNPYVSFLGPANRAAQRIATMGICNKIGGILAPVTLASLAIPHVEKLEFTNNLQNSLALQQKFTSAIYWPYVGMAALLALAILYIRLSNLPDIKLSDTKKSITEPYATTQLPSAVWMGVMAMFLYVGIEVLAGDAIGTYASGFQIPVRISSLFTSATLVCMLCGYLLGLVCVPRVFSQERALMLSCIIGFGLSILAYITHGYVSVACIALLGFANSMIFPSLFPTVLKNAPNNASFVSALLVMAYCGGGILPQCFVWLKTIIGFQAAFSALSCLSYIGISMYILRFSQHTR
ncbi:glucose/galactose transporter [Acetobacter aceti 1023]|nr:glucose/galactose transporter [Acetobacter aceti 1023]